jgi:hypothetical protein
MGFSVIEGSRGGPETEGNIIGPRGRCENRRPGLPIHQFFTTGRLAAGNRFT